MRYLLARGSRFVVCAFLTAHVRGVCCVVQVDGMSHLAAVHLLFMNPCKSFICMANMLGITCLEQFLVRAEKSIRKRVAFFDAQLGHDIPSLHSHFSRNGITPDMYFVDW